MDAETLDASVGSFMTCLTDSFAALLTKRVNMKCRGNPWWSAELSAMRNGVEAACQDFGVVQSLSCAIQTSGHCLQEPGIGHQAGVQEGVLHCELHQPLSGCLQALMVRVST